MIKYRYVSCNSHLIANAGAQVRCVPGWSDTAGGRSSDCSRCWSDRRAAALGPARCRRPPLTRCCRVVLHATNTRLSTSPRRTSGSPCLSTCSRQHSFMRQDTFPTFMRWIQLRFDCDSTAVRLQFDCNSTALRSFDDLHYDSRPTYVWRLHCGLNQSIGQRDCG